MCSDMPNMPKEANKAKCFVISCFVLCAALPRALIPVSPRLSRTCINTSREYAGSSKAVRGAGE